MTQLILIRHGETTWNRERRMQGHTDTSLSDTGRAQAAAVGRRLANQQFAALYSSDLMRAYDTASAIAPHIGLPIVRDAALRERTFGIFEGLTSEEIAQRHPEENARFQTRDPDYAMPGGESSRQFYQRSLSCLEGIAAKHAGETVVVVTHGLVLDTLYRAAHKLALEIKREAPLLNASLNTFHRAEAVWSMLVWGDVEHLAEVGVTYYGGRAV